MQAEAKERQFSRSKGLFLDIKEIWAQYSIVVEKKGEYSRTKKEPLSAETFFVGEEHSREKTFGPFCAYLALAQQNTKVRTYIYIIRTYIVLYGTTLSRNLLSQVCECLPNCFLSSKTFVWAWAKLARSKILDKKRVEFVYLLTNIF